MFSVTQLKPILSMDEIFSEVVGPAQSQVYKNWTIRYLDSCRGISDTEIQAITIIRASIIQPNQWVSLRTNNTQCEEEIKLWGTKVFRKISELACLFQICPSYDYTTLLDIPSDFQGPEDYIRYSGRHPNWRQHNGLWTSDKERLLAKLPEGARKILFYWFLPDDYKSPDLSKEGLSKAFPDEWQQIRKAMWGRCLGMRMNNNPEYSKSHFAFGVMVLLVLFLVVKIFR